LRAVKKNNSVQLKAQSKTKEVRVRKNVRSKTHLSLLTIKMKNRPKISKEILVNIGKEVDLDLPKKFHIQNRETKDNLLTPIIHMEEAVLQPVVVGLTTVVLLSLINSEKIVLDTTDKVIKTSTINANTITTIITILAFKAEIKKTKDLNTATTGMRTCFHLTVLGNLNWRFKSKTSITKTKLRLLPNSL
jgi:hypothetical protein